MEVPIEINDDRDSLEEQLKVLIEAARIIKAVHWRTLDPKGDVAGKIKGIIKQSGDLLDNLGAKDKAKLEEFLQSLEKGFSDKDLSLDPSKPFGREYDRRPKARRINNNGQTNTSQ